MNSGEKIYGEFVITCGDGEMIEFVEATCDEVALEMERRITTASGLAATRRRDTRPDSPLGQPVDDRRVIHVGVAGLCSG